MGVQSVAADSHLRSSQAMAISSQNALSIAVWINANWSSGARNSFVGIYGPVSDVPLGAPVTAIQIGTAAGAGDITCWTWGGVSLVAGSGMATYNNAWIHVVYTFDGLNHRLYLNGAQLATSTTTQITGMLNQVYINGYPGGGTAEVATHQVDSYALYRTTLTADQVMAMYKAGGSRHGIVSNLIAQYEFDEGIDASAVTQVIDVSGNGHHLTTVGAAATTSPLTYTYTNTVANSNIRPVL